MNIHKTSVFVRTLKLVMTYLYPHSPSSKRGSYRSFVNLRKKLSVCAKKHMNVTLLHKERPM